MKALLVVAAAGAAYLVHKLTQSEQAGAAPADPAAPMVPVDESGNVLPQDPATGQPVSDKAKIPTPVKPATWTRQPRFVTKTIGGREVTFYNDKYVYTLRDVLNAYRAQMYTPGDGRVRYQLLPLGTVGPGTFNALDAVRSLQSQGYTVIAARTLLDGSQGQVYAVMWGKKGSVESLAKVADAAELAQYAVLPKLPPMPKV